MPVGTDILPSRYRSAQRVGHGGMGEIYRANDETLGRTVAIKLLAERYAEDQSIRLRFMREALAAARHPGERPPRPRRRRLRASDGRPAVPPRVDDGRGRGPR